MRARPIHVRLCLWLSTSPRRRSGMVDLGDGLAGQLHAKSHSMQAILEHMTHWTHQREVFLQLTNGTYQTQRIVTDIQELIQRVAPSDLVAEYDCPPIIITDTNMLCLVLEEALSNARKYRAKGTPVQVKVWMVPMTDGSSTDEWLRVNITNVNMDGVGLLTAEECRAAFKPGAKNVHQGGASVLHDAEQLSDGLGLDTVRAALRVTGGEASLRGFLGSDDKPRTVFSLSHPSEHASEVQIRLFKSSIRPSQKLEANLESRRPPVCVGIDDSRILQGALSAVFEMLGAAPESVTVGSSLQELDGCFDLILGGESRPRADIAVIDQNLDWDGSPYMQGTKMAERLRAAGFDGIIIIYTGASLSEMAQIRECPYADDHVEKGSSLLELSNRLGLLYYEKLHRKDSSSSSISGTHTSQGFDLLSCASPISDHGASSFDASFRKRPHTTIKSATDKDGALPLINLQGLVVADIEVWRPIYDTLFDPQSSTSIAAQIERMQVVVDSGNPVSSMAHRLCGEARVAGLDAIANCCTCLIKDPDNVAALLSELRSLCARTATKAKKMMDARGAHRQGHAVADRKIR
mmetsp:Transcript_50068/g.138746  ORF Transcript_50068/g.138746 Transcript_50068/m.138746 type:complete len:578 (-) Transcript_50068:21-1754(-)